MSCFGKRKLGNWVFLCVSVEIKTQEDKAIAGRRTKKLAVTANDLMEQTAQLVQHCFSGPEY